MDQDTVKTELEAKRRPGAVVARLSGVKQLASLLTGRGVIPPTVRAVMQDAFEAQVHLRPSVIHNRGDELDAQFKNFGPDDWQRLVAALLPNVAPSAVAAIDALERRPYQTGIARRPFRCPGVPITVGRIRGRWLLHTTLLVGEFDADICWIAERAAHIAGWWGSVELGWLLAGAIDAGGATGQRVQDILMATASGDAESGRMGRHVTQALMTCGKPDAWEFVEKLLLSALRQEGLRQSILESVDESHPQAFRRMLRLILDEDLARFSSVVRAADTWFGFMWDGSSGMKIQGVLERVSRFLDDPAACQAALNESDGETVYLALWSIAFANVNAAIDPASALLRSPTVAVRFAATHFLLEAMWTSGIPPLADMLADADLAVAARALDMFTIDRTNVVDGGQLFGAIEQLLQRLPKRGQTVGSPIWPWWKRKLDRSTAAAALAANASKVPGERLLPYVPDLSPWARAAFIRDAAGIAGPYDTRAPGTPRKLAPAERRAILEMLGDASPEVRTAASQALDAVPLQTDEVDRLVDLLARKAGDLRNRALKRLGTLPDAGFLTVADRLLGDADELRRLAGLELLRAARESKRLTAEVAARMQRYAADHTALTDREQAHVSSTLSPTAAPATRDDGLGLLDRGALWTWPEPRARPVELDTPGARASLDSLAQLVLQHQHSEHRAPDGQVRQLVQAVHWGFGPRTRDDRERGDALPLAAVWKKWASERGSALRDPDGCELLRVLLADQKASPWTSRAAKEVSGLGMHSSGMYFLRGLCEWSLAWDPPSRAAEFLLDGLENEIAGLSAADYRELAAEQAKGPTAMLLWAQKPPAHRARVGRAEAWLTELRRWRELFPAALAPAQAVRLYGLLRAFAARSHGFDALRVRLDDFLPAYASGMVREADFVDLLVGTGSHRGYHALLRVVSLRKPPKGLGEHPQLVALVDRCRRRVVEVESQRGDRETGASELSLQLRWTGGLDTLARAVPALGKTHFTRRMGWSVTAAARQDTLSHLVVRSVPREEDTPAAFARWAKESKITEARLIELAVYAPQWAGHVNQILKWPGLEDAVWWVQAHTKDDRSWQLPELKEVWAAEVSERTALSAVDLTEGAVDVAWFMRVYAQLGEERWKKLDTAAKYAASNGGHTRAQLFARAMAGLVTRDDLQARIDTNRHQDSVRALGLLPLPTGEALEQEVLDRFQRLMEFRRQARQFGSQRQQSEKRAVTIGLENLARTAGYRDPQRLQWAMEQRAVADLASGPLVVTRGDVAISLSVDADGQPALSATKNGKPLKAIPAALKKDGDVAELASRLQELRRQRSRVRDSLEDAMCRGDRFAAGELRTLLEHPLLAPALSRLLFVGEGVAGYLADGGRTLRDHAGKSHALGREEIRIAHPDDLLKRGDWSAWQHECYRAERVQPFKQVFRELYPMTEAERGTQGSSRYAGHQVNPRQALALFGRRGWVAHPEEGVSRTFHEDGLTARLTFQETFFTPADIEGLTLEDVVFTKKGEWKTLALDLIPARLFSETLRDLDLVVSVAHRGGVDPEATASTVEMRAALVRETCELLALSNVELQKHHAMIQGKLARYSVHLGSGGVMVMPGSAVPIVAVHSQFRGRLFLPFADDDPRTAEVLSKVLLLARDAEIKDPNILDWIRAAQGGPV